MAATLKLGDRKWATKEGSLLAYNDENNNIKPLPFDFTRASSATRVNKQGLIETVASGVPRIDYTDANGALFLEPQRTNSLLQSNQFDTTWNGGGTLTDGQTGYDGSNDAWLFTNSAPTGALNQTNLNSGVQTFSAYFKKNASNGVRVYIIGTSNRWAFFNLSNGTIHSSVGLIDSNIEAIGTDWYRCSVTYDDTNSFVRFYVTDNASSQVLGTFTLQNSQLESGSYATSYIPTQGSAVTRLSENFDVKTLNYGSVFSMVFNIDGLGGSTANNFFIQIGATNAIYLSVRSSDKKLQFYSSVSGVGYFATIASKKIAISCDGTNWIWASDGASGTLIALGAPNATYIKIKTDGSSGGGIPSIKLNQMLFFETALTSSELEALTTI